MGSRILVVGEVGADATLTKLSTEVATLARALAGPLGAETIGLIPGAGGEAAATELAGYLPSVIVDDGVGADATASERAATVFAALETNLTDVHHVLLPASSDGRDLAGALSSLTGWGVLANATGAGTGDEGLVVEQSVFGGKLITRSSFTDGTGIVTVRPNSVTAVPGDAAGTVSTQSTTATANVAPVRLVERIDAEGAAVSIDDARIIVAGGRGVGGPDGFGLLQDLADELGGAVGATRAAVDSGWIAYSQQIGQTGKIVKPQLYLALGISGAIQHKVGMQTAESIVAVNRDPDAPLASFADVYVVGDLVEVGRALLDELRRRRG